MQQLCVEVSSKGFTYSVVNRNSKEITDSGSLIFSGRTEEDHKTEIKELLEKKGLLSFQDEVSLAVLNHQSTLVPQNVFSESTPQAIFNLCFGNTSLDIDYNRFHEQSLVNVFAIPNWVKSFFVMRYPRIIIQHENTHLMRGIFNGSTFSPTAHLAIQDDYFSLIITSKNKLDFYNIFEYKSVEDFIYHTLFVLEQKEMNLNELKVNWHAAPSFDNLFNDFKSTLNRLKPNAKFNFQHIHHIKHHLFCV